MTDTPNASVRAGSPAEKRLAHRPAHAARVPKPVACGCGLPVVFDLDKHEFFCIGCGGARECVCLRSHLSSNVRPVRVA